MSERPEPDPRVYFAAERTFLAWIRTGLALMGFGFIVARFGLFLREMAAITGEQAESPPLSRWFGIALIAIGVLLTAAALVSHVATVRRLNRGEPFVGRPSLIGATLAMFLVIAGMAMTIYLFYAA